MINRSDLCYKSIVRRKLPAAMVLSTAGIMLVARTAFAEPASSLMSTLISCQSEASDDEYLVELNVPTEYGLMNCVWGLVGDMTPCSANRQWSLSYPTGTAGLAETRATWPEAHDHTGGKFWTNLGPLMFEAKAGFGEGLPQEVMLSVDRTTGVGHLNINSRSSETILCQVVERRF